MHVRTRFVLYAAFFALVISVVSFGIAHSLHREAATRYVERCSLYAYALASTSASWLPVPGGSTDQQLRYPLLSLGVVYLRVNTDEGLVMDIRRPEFAQAHLPLPDDRGPFVAATIHHFGDHWVVDVVLPHMIARTADAAEATESLGALQLGIDATELASTNQRTTTITAFLSSAIWVFAMIALSFLPRLRNRQDNGNTEHCATAADAARRLASGDLILCLDDLRLEIGSVAIELTPKQAALLELLMNQPGRAFSDANILEQVWPASPYANSSDVKQQIYLIRKRLRTAGLPASEILATVPGIGYKLVVTPNDAHIDAASTDLASS